jgi:hypothetical protein
MAFIRRVKLETRKTEAPLGREGGRHGRAKRSRAWDDQRDDRVRLGRLRLCPSACLRLTAMLTAHSAEHAAP